MAKRNRSLAARQRQRHRRRARKKAAKEGIEAKTSDKVVDDTFRQLTREFWQLDGKRAKLSEKQHELEQKVRNEQRTLEEQQRKLEEEQKRKLQKQKRKLEEEHEHKVEQLKHDMEEQLRPLRHEVEQLQQDWLPKRDRLKDACSAREAENAKHLTKLPQEVWERILDELKDDDLFPLALSCRFFRQKQKELVARAKQDEPESKKPRLALKTNLKQKLEKVQPVSAEYLRFCRKENVPKNIHRQKAFLITYLAAFHGYLPLLQELLAGSEILCDSYITEKAGESSTSQSLHLLLVLVPDFFLAFSASQRREANWRPCSG